MLMSFCTYWCLTSRIIVVKQKVQLVRLTSHYINLRMFWNELHSIHSRIWSLCCLMCPSLLLPQRMVMTNGQASKCLVGQACQPFHGHMLLVILELILTQVSYQQVEACAKVNGQGHVSLLALQMLIAVPSQTLIHSVMIRALFLHLVVQTKRISHLYLLTFLSICWILHLLYHVQKILGLKQASFSQAT